MEQTSFTSAHYSNMGSYQNQTRQPMDDTNFTPSNQMQEVKLNFSSGFTTSSNSNVHASGQPTNMQKRAAFYN